MKRALALVFCAMMTLSLMTVCPPVSVAAQTVSTEPSSSDPTVSDCLGGDVNADGKVNNRDFGVLQQYNGGWDVTIHSKAADVNGDNVINNRDLGLIQQHLNGYDVELVPVKDEVLTQVPSELSSTNVDMLIWWSPDEDDQDKAAMFQEKTGINVRYQTSNLNKYQANLAAKIMAGNPPAVAAIINEWYPQPITRGLMQPISNTGWDYSDPIYATSLMDQFSYKGKQYGIALKNSAITTFEVMFFNKTMMAEDVAAGTDPYSLWKKGQWNWETCLSLAQKYTNPSREKYGLTMINQHYWMLSAGQDYVLSDIDGLQNNIRSAKVLDAWYWAWDMFNTYKVIPAMFSQQQQLFFSGSVAMLGGGSYFMQVEEESPYGYYNYVPQNCDFDWGVVPFPSPKGRSPVAACEGTVWGFPVNVRGNQLQAGMWYLRYYLDDVAYYDIDEFYGSEECWEVMNWMWKQKIQSFNSAGVLSYGGKYSPAHIQYTLIDESTTKSQVQANLNSWYDVLDSQINMIMTELE